MTSPIEDQEAFLTDGDIEIEGRMPWSSNATFLVRVHISDLVHRAIYKPVRGERPLWDFDPGLHRREAAAYRLSTVLGLGIVPTTVIRDGPFGVGSVQWFVEADHSEHYFTILEQRPDLHHQLRAMAAFDVVANNTDRKAGHCLVAGDHIWGIDHGLCFAAEDKLRTVIWEFAGEPVDAELKLALEQLSRAVPLDVSVLLDDDENLALQRRAASLADDGVLPADPSGHRYPWPLV
jgi:uncharacterized repeat protein (TIGR03843 family)